VTAPLRGAWMDAERSQTWEAEDYLTSLDRFFEIETMEDWATEVRSDSFVVDWNLKRAA
jgi:hypothetical protein